MTSSFNLPTGSRPSITPSNSILPCRQEEGLLNLRKLSQHLNFMMGCHRSFTSGGQRPRSGSPPPTPPPPIEKRQWRYSRIWKGLVQVVMHRFALMSAWRPTLGPHGQIFKQRSRISSSQGTTRSGQGPNSCIFNRAPTSSDGQGSTLGCQRANPHPDPSNPLPTDPGVWVIPTAWRVLTPSR